MTQPHTLFLAFASALIAASTSADQLVDGWSTSPDRIWIGPAYHTNRLQDWRIANGRLECTETAKRLPVRTCHVLTHSISTQPEAFELAITTGPIDADAPATENATSNMMRP